MNDSKIRCPYCHKQIDITARIAKERVRIRAEVETQNALRLRDRDTLITTLKSKIKDLLHRIEQGSQQAAGDAQEVHLDKLLRAAFPTEKIERGLKGVRGADFILTVAAPGGEVCGRIIIESKRTQKFEHKWIDKLRRDQLMAMADIAVLISDALPANVGSFTQINGVWCVRLSVAVELVTVLRHELMQVHAVLDAVSKIGGCAEPLVNYLTGTQFKLRIESAMATLDAMRGDLEREKQSTTLRWSRRSEQIQDISMNLLNINGDIAGIIGAHQPLVEHDTQ